MNIFLVATQYAENCLMVNSGEKFNSNRYVFFSLFMPLGYIIAFYDVGYMETYVLFQNGIQFMLIEYMQISI